MTSRNNPVKRSTSVVYELTRPVSKLSPGLALAKNKNGSLIVNESDAVVVNLNQDRTSLIEVIAKAGGLDRSLKSYNIRIIRGDIKNPQVQLVDLSTLEGMRKAELGMEPNDIIYVSQRKRIVADAFAEATPFLSAAGLIFSTVILIRTIGK